MRAITLFFQLLDSILNLLKQLQGSTQNHFEYDWIDPIDRVETVNQRLHVLDCLHGSPFQATCKTL